MERSDFIPVLAAHGERLLRENVLLVGLAERALFEVERLPQLNVHRRVAAARSELRKKLSYKHPLTWLCFGYVILGTFSIRNGLSILF